MGAISCLDVLTVMRLMRGVITASHTFIHIIKAAEPPQTDEFIASYKADMVYHVEQHDTVVRV